MQYVYIFYNNKDEVLYVGKTSKLSARFNQHKKDKSWFNEVEYIKYSNCPKEFMIDLYEIYYINSLNPKYNRKDININHINFSYPELTFKKYEKFKKENNKLVNYIGTAKNVPYSENSFKDVSFFRITNQVTSKDYVNHHILLADCSGSMYSNMNKLKEKIVQTMQALSQIPNSYVSVIKYSSHNEASVLISTVKCDDVSYKMNLVYEKVNSGLFANGVTVISEPLEMAITSCKSLAGIADKHHIAVFTDGCLVPMKWSSKQEADKCFEVAKICNSNGIFLNAIGFGQYYDREFLNELVEKAGNGEVIHIDHVENYYDVIMKAIEKVNRVHMSKNTISCTGKVVELDSGNIGKEFTTYGDSKVLAVFDSDSLEVDNVLYLKDCDKVADEEFVDTFMLCIAKKYLQEEDIDNYEFVVKALGDISLFEETQDCYSFIEKGNTINKVNAVISDTSLRFKNGREPIIESSLNEKPCVIEMLTDIINDPNSHIYWDVNTPYNRITQKTNSLEDNISFIRMNEGLIEVNDISIGSEKLNIGIKVGIKGTVKDSISGLEHPATIFRDYNLINGGNINVPYINAVLSEDMLNKYKDCVEVNDKYTIPNVTKMYKINFSGLKSANKRLLKSLTMTEIKDTLYNISLNKCYQWAVNKRIKEIIGDKDSLDFTSLPPDEIEVRKALRIDEFGIYKPLATEKDETTPFDRYPAIYMSWDIKIPEKKIKEEFWEDVSKMDELDELKKELKQKKQETKELEFKINCVRIACAMMNKNPFLWDAEVEKDKTVTDKTFGVNSVVNGKAKTYTKVIDESVVTQTKWLQMVKCN